MIKKTDYDNSSQMTLSMLSHEIRNHLTLIYSTLQLIESQHPEVKGFKYWSDLHRDFDDMTLLLHELSDYNNSQKLHLTTVNSEAFFKKLALSFAADAMNHHIQFTSRIDPTLPDLSCDEIKLRQVILNLLSNARDAVMDTREPSIYLSVTGSTDTIHIVVEDNGCGIPDDKLCNIFEPFITYKKNGTGLGLAIASRIMKAHHGSIHVSSVPCHGTTFSLTLPIKQDT